MTQSRQLSVTFEESPELVLDGLDAVIAGHLESTLRSFRRMDGTLEQDDLIVLNANLTRHDADTMEVNVTVEVSQ